MQEERERDERFTHTGFVKSPDTFLQPLLSPPQIPHLSNFLSEPIFPSQPALMHFPMTHTPVESGEHGVPSTTCLGSHLRLEFQVDRAGKSHQSLAQNINILINFI